MKQIALFGGTFDPIHLGHLNLAIEVMEKLSMDKILFCPANVSPYKVEDPPRASGKERAEMINLAIENIKNFSLYDEEIKKIGVSYTIDTLRSLKRKYQDSHINLVIDQKILKRFPEWVSYEEIIRLATIVISCFSLSSLEEFRPWLERIPSKKSNYY